MSFQKERSSCNVHVNIETGEQTELDHFVLKGERGGKSNCCSQSELNFITPHVCS